MKVYMNIIDEVPGENSLAKKSSNFNYDRSDSITAINVYGSDPAFLREDSKNINETNIFHSPRENITKTMEKDKRSAK